MGAVEHDLMRLLVTATECQLGLGDAASLIDDGRIELVRRLLVQTAGSSVQIDLRADVTVEIDEEAGVHNEFGCRVSVEVSDTGFRVTGVLDARLAVAMGDVAPGTYTLYENQTGVLGLEEALVALRSQVASFWTLPAAVGLRRD